MYKPRSHLLLAPLVQNSLSKNSRLHKLKLLCWFFEARIKSSLPDFSEAISYYILRRRFLEGKLKEQKLKGGAGENAFTPLLASLVWL